MKSYKEPYYYWESVFIFRRLILTLVATFLLGTVLKLFVLSLVRKKFFLKIFQLLIFLLLVLCSDFASS